MNKIKAHLSLLSAYQNHVYLAIGLSVAALSGAFASPGLFAVGVFFFLSPLLCRACQKGDLGFKEGLLWGIFYFGIHFMAFVQGIIYHGQTWVRFAAPVFLVGYCALYAGIWFFCAQQISRLKSGSIWFILSAWIVATFLYFYWMRYYVFWVIEWGAGYCFAYPLLPLAEYVQSLYLLKFVPEEVLLLWLIFINAWIAYALIKKRAIYFIVLPLLSLPFWIGFFIHEPTGIPEYINKIGWIQPPKKRDNPLETAQEITYRLQALFAKHPQLELVLLPEASFPFSLNKHNFAIDMWFDHAVPEKSTIIIGSHYNNEKKLFNSAFLILLRRIIRRYDKVNLMPYTEKFINNQWGNILNKLFIKDSFYFNRGNNNECITFILFNDITLYPQICSDLLWKSTRVNHKTILWLTNDTWFFMPYMQHVLHLFARYSAVVKKSSIFYISHTRGVFISLNGKEVALSH